MPYPTPQFQARSLINLLIERYYRIENGPKFDFLLTDGGQILITLKVIDMPTDFNPTIDTFDIVVRFYNLLSERILNLPNVEEILFHSMSTTELLIYLQRVFEIYPLAQIGTWNDLGI